MCREFSWDLVEIFSEAIVSHPASSQHSRLPYAGFPLLLLCCWLHPPVVRPSCTKVASAVSVAGLLCVSHDEVCCCPVGPRLPAEDLQKYPGGPHQHSR